MRAASSISLAATILVAPLLNAADPAQQVASFSAFKKIDTGELTGGGILSERGSSSHFDRGLSAQTCFFVRKPVADTARLLATWDPVNHKDLEVYSSRNFSGGGDPKLDSLSLDASAQPVRRLLEDTWKGATDSPSFQCSASDLSLLRKVIPPESAEKADPDSREFRKLAERFWANLLQSRLEAFRKGGITALPPYKLEDQSVPIHGEIIAMLAQDPAVESRFRPLLAEAVLQSSAKAPPAPETFYWQVLNSDKKATCCLGAIYTRRIADQWQVVDYQLYSSDSYLTLVTLYELWPLKSGSETGTLVWRGDYVSSPTFSSLRGVEQMAAAALMIKSIKKNIAYFQEDAARASSAIASTEKTASLE